MVQTPNDAHKLKINEQKFIHKPLKNLLKEIKPEIKTVLRTIDNASYFVFYFMIRDEMNHKVKMIKTVSLLTHQCSLSNIYS